MPLTLSTDVPAPKFPACDAKRAEDLLKEIEQKLNVPEDEREAFRRHVLALAREYQEHRNAPSGTMVEVRELLEELREAARTLISDSKKLRLLIPIIGATS